MSKKEIQNIQFVKSDQGKLQISLVPTEFIRNVASIRMYGNAKYNSPNNWVVVEKQRYIDALMRHLLAYLDDNNSKDEESGLPHLWHAACNIAFICEMERSDWEDIKNHMIEKDPKLKKKIKELSNEVLDKTNDSDDPWYYPIRKDGNK